MAETDPRLQFRKSPQSSDIEGPLSLLLDYVFGDTLDTVIQRNVDGWGIPIPGNSGDVYTCGGQVGPNYWAPSGSYAAPEFTSFAISGQSRTLEVGATISAGTKTFTWSTSNSANVQANSISITDTTASVVLASGLANTGSDAIAISAITNNSPASQIWTIDGVNTHNGTFSRTFEVDWYWRVYAGTNAAATLTANQIKALSDFSGLESGFPGTYPLSNVNGFKYFCFPDSMGNVALFFDPNGNFPWSMATSSDNAAYSHHQSSGGDYYYALVSVTNAQGVSTNYRVYRSTYSFAGTPVFQVS